jgi:type IV fimbrial biogenesis protein FimT
MKIHQVLFCLPLKNSTKQAGFSLVEVLIVVGIMGIAAAMAVPNYIQWSARSQLKQAATELQGSLNLARMAAMNRNASVTMNLALSGAQWTADFGGVIPPFTMPIGITTTAATVRFNSLGLLVGVGGPILLSNGSSQTYSVGITPGGRTRWCQNTTGIC